MMMNGFKFFNGHKLVTIFSASHYYPDKVTPLYSTVSPAVTGKGTIKQAVIFVAKCIVANFKQ